MRFHLTKVLGVCAGIYIGLALGVYLIQDSLIFHPDTRRPDIERARATVPQLAEVSFRLASGQEIYGWFASPARRREVVLFLHGNACHIGCFVPRVRPFVEAGYGALLVEYPGYGGLAGKPSQAGMEQAALASVRFLNSNGYPNVRVIVYGYSLGTYAGVYLAEQLGQQEPFHALILEAPFLSLARIARESVHSLLPVSLLLKGRYPSDEKIEAANTRLFVAHGKRDQVVPYHQGEALFRKAKGKKVFFSSEKADHNTLPQNGFSEAVLDWLAAD